MASIIVIGASAGGVDALQKLVSFFPADFPGAVLIVLHTTGRSNLVQLLKLRSKLPISYAIDGEKIVPGKIWIAPPAYHLVVYHQRLLLSQGPRQNSVRPSIDPLFESAAREYGNRVAAVILSGTLDDGCVGIEMVKRNGGLTIVQDPDESAWPDLPRNALATGAVDLKLPVAQIAAKLVEHAIKPPKPKRGKTQPELIVDVKRAVGGEADPSKLPSGTITTLTCPECGGTLWERRSGNLLRFKCHTGHSYASRSLLEANGQRVEQAMWMTIRILKERAALLSKLGRQSANPNRNKSRRGFLDKAEELEKQASSLIDVLMGDGSRQKAHIHRID